jgi:hypothetical protein
MTNFKGRGPTRFPMAESTLGNGKMVTHGMEPNTTKAGS